MVFKENSRGKERAWLGAAILVVGILIGIWADPRAWFRGRSDGSPDNGYNTAGQLAPHLEQQPTAPGAEDNGLPTIFLDIAPEHAEVIQQVYDLAMARGQIVQEPSGTVPATLRHEDDSHPIELRIKGDLLDHIETDQWSFRIRMQEGRLFGMRTFSIQRPATRGFMWEWLVFQAAHRVNLLAPRASFVNVVINNNRCGLYFLEEHFSKELLESQGRREGPIVLFDESTFWATSLHVHKTALDLKVPIPDPLIPATELSRAGVRAFGAKRLASLESLNRGLVSAMTKIQELQDLAILETSQVTRMEKMQALARITGRTMETFLDAGLWARAHAMASVFQIWHGLVWFNLRLYHNPLTDRLEPILFDNMAHIATIRDPVILQPDPLVVGLAKSPAYTKTFYNDLGRFCEPSFVEDLFADLKPEMRVIEAALARELHLAPKNRIDGMKQRLREQQIYLRKLLNPRDPINFQCTFEQTSGQGGAVGGMLEVKAWATTRIPVVLDGFRFSNGGFVPAASCLQGAPEAKATGAMEGVTLPVDGSRLHFRFPADQRLTNLSSIQELKRAIRAGESGQGAVKLDEIKAMFRMATGGVVREEVLDFYPCEAAWRSEQGRPEFPDLESALNDHPFLVYDIKNDRLKIRQGTWEVKGDLLVPAGYALYAPPGVVLKFESGAVLASSSPLLFKGTANEPIVLEPASEEKAWCGLVVLNARDRSYFTHVTIRSTNSLARGGWTTTGGITFYHAPVTMYDCWIQGTRAEDGLNLYGADILLERVRFTQCASDSFDGDFVTGLIRDCRFEAGQADGADFSGSDVEVQRCFFSDLGDKALSVGEKSRCVIKDCEATRVSIGLAAKDLSEVEVEGFVFNDVRRHAIAVYVKKPEYGPSSVAARNVTITGPGKEPFLVQTGSTLTVEGQMIPAKDFDVERLYDQKVLGN